MGYSVEDVKRVIAIGADKAVNSKPMLTLLDSYSGDGDMGISMEKGAHALTAVITAYNGQSIGQLLVECGFAFNKAAASTIGTLLSSAMTMTGKKLADKNELADADVLMIPEYMTDAIIMRGNASLGDKTILDALIPFSRELRASYSRSSDLNSAVSDAARAAKAAAKATKGIIAVTGRAKWIGERSREYPDPGAVMCALIVDAIAHPEKEEGYKLPDYEACTK